MAKSDGEMFERADREYLARNLALGNVVLFTGAGFTHDCLNKAGSPVPLGSGLRSIIWLHAFPSAEFDESEELGDIYDVAVRNDPKGLLATLKTALTLDPKGIPNWYQRYLDAPWKLVYTLNFDDFWELAPQVFPVDRSLRPLSALDSETLAEDSTGAVVHLNGRLQDYPRTTFSDRQYGRRLTVPDKWFHELSAHLRGYPVVFIGSTLHEPLLWQYIEYRHADEGRRNKPAKSFLISKGISAARQSLLRDLNIHYYEGTASDFAGLLAALAQTVQ